MKLIIALFLGLAYASIGRCEDWKIHGAIGTNPYLEFYRCTPAGIDTKQLRFGTDFDGNSISNVWFIENTLVVDVQAVEGDTVTLSGDFTANQYNVQVNCPNGGSINTIGCGISGTPPDWIGWSTTDGPSIAGEYWVDWGTDMQIRITEGAVSPVDFGKWLGDGYVNPYYVEPLALKSKGKKHRK